MKTYSAKKGEIEKKWYLIDAEDKILGRLATEVADILRGKKKPEYTPNMDTGDFVIIINADKIKVTGSKLQQKKYYRFTGYIGNLKEVNLETLLKKHPERVIMNAVKGMLPKNTLGREMFKKLKVYAGNEHKHQAQMPEALEL
jgi:large subunit ribosomal protein L13